MFERFTELARQVVVAAQEEARALKRNYIGTEHILLGLARVRDGLAAQARASLDVTLDAVRAEVALIVGEGDEAITGQIPFTPRAKMVLEFGLREALSLSDNYVGAEHLLLGLTRVVGERIRIEVIRLLSGALDGTSETWADRLGEWRRDGWELISVVQVGGAV